MFLRQGLGLLALLASGVLAATVHGKHHNHLQGVYDKRQSSNTTDEYEYVIVGSGPGGGPLASRLAIAGHKVLLIEAGDDQGDSILYQAPALHLQSTEYEPMRWDYWVNHYPDLERQKKDSKFTYRKSDGQFHVGATPPADAEPLGILYPRAGTLGGCASHNALITVYPHKSDWLTIQTITGDDSWAPEKMRKLFQRLERARYVPNGLLGHGFEGWFETSLTDLGLVLQDLKLLSLVVAIGTAMGKSVGKVITTIAGLTEVLLADINVDTPLRDSTEAVYQVPLAVNIPEYKRNGPREFILETANAVNEDGSRKYHLDIALNTLVTNVRFDKSGPTPRAVGVDFLKGQSLYSADPRASGAKEGTPGSVTATREVILSAGAFNTPQLLKLSGIGPKDELEKFDIPVLVDLPGVGQNLQDRYEVGLVGETETDFPLTSKCTFLTTDPDPCLEQYLSGHLALGKGTYTTNGLAVAVVKRSSAASGDPDLFIAGAPAFFSGYYPGYSAKSLSDARHWTWIPLKAHTRNNAGTIKLRSKDPRDMPEINFNYFDAGVTTDGADEKDLQAVVEGVELSREIFKNVVPIQGSFKEVWPGTERANDTESLKEFIKNEAWGHHASCTCPIGADDDPMAVLDSKFRVRGVEGLRVVDASVFPKIPGFYIAVPIYMISEKAADVILEAATVV
ncbi:choline dehydrogenase [Blastomyces silverae]|uniref:Choline dehydrogenase n=1 Tax=Blastomyces silverae TaxID=2060906 RepID=A0A0H1BLB5_9EURO|nr:choline dehydrogenase [Blastomyces silverae]